MGDFYVSVGQSAEFTKTVGETDVYLFAGVTGDFSPNHVNQRYMERSSYGTRMAHGALLVGFMSTASTLAIAATRDAAETPVAVGYDRIRFLRPVLLGDTITVVYTIAAIDLQRRRSTAEIRVTNQRDELVAVAQHILQWVANEPSASAPGASPTGDAPGPAPPGVRSPVGSAADVPIRQPHSAHSGAHRAAGVTGSGSPSAGGAR